MRAVTDWEQTLGELVKEIRDQRAEARAHRETLLRVIDRMDRLEDRDDEHSEALRRQTGLMETMVETLKAMTLAMNRLAAKLE